MKEHIANLYNETIKNKEYQKQIDDFIHSDYEYDTWRKKLFDIEQKIGGIGVHNVNTFFLGNENHATGSYRRDDRSIFRPIQYCSTALFQHYIVLDTRYFIDNSCAHIESLLKRIYLRTTHNAKHKNPMGRVIKALSETDIGTEFHDQSFKMIT